MPEAGITSGNGGRSEINIEGGQGPAFPLLEQLVGRMLGEKAAIQKAPSGGRVDIEMGE